MGIKFFICNNIYFHGRDGESFEINSRYSFRIEQSHCNDEAGGDDFWYVFSIFDRELGRVRHYYKWSGSCIGTLGCELSKLERVEPKKLTITIFEPVN